ncbi:MAG: response regulator [Lachnospiraceae bacterium]|nr:response regulator [Lachnospiraceae bacterium]
MKKEKTFGKKSIVVCEIIAVILAVLLLVYIFTATILSRHGSTRGNYESLNSGWSFIRSTGRTTEVTLPIVERARDREVLTIENVLPNVISPGEYVSLRAVDQEIKIFINDKLRTSYASDPGYLIWDRPISKYLYVPLTSEDSGAKIRIEGVNNSKGNRTFTEVYTGELSAIKTKYMGDQLVGIILATSFFALGIVTIIAGYTMRVMIKAEMHLESMGWAMLIMSLWDLTQSDFRDFIFSNQNLIYAVPVMALMLIPMHLSIYMNWIQERRYQKAHTIFVGACIVNTFFWVLLSASRIISPEHAVETSFVFLYGELVLALLTAYQDKKKYGKITYSEILAGYVIVSFCGIFQICNFYIPGAKSDGMFLAGGFAALTFAAFINALKKMVLMQGERQAAIQTTELKSQFLATMSHEIRTPINAIMGMNEAIIRESSEENIVAYANDVENAGKLLLYLVNDILDFSKLESGKMNLVYAAYSVKKLISKSYNLIIGKVREKGLEIDIDVDENTPSVLYGDEVRIQQILINILNNAVKYTENGSINLKVGFEPGEKETINLKMTVKDTGRGIKEEHLGKLFDAFMRVEDAGVGRVEGTGLGLAITAKFVELMEGTIDVKSEYGKGSEFMVVIPQKIISENPLGKFTLVGADGQEEHKTLSDVKKFTGVKMLVVDDVQLNIKVVLSLLKKSEMEIDSALSGMECLEKCKNTKYDIILLDHMMPEKDGIQTLWDLRRDKGNINIDTPVVMMTANAMNGAREEYMGLGFSDYVSKPFNLTQLQKIIEKNLKLESN